MTEPTLVAPSDASFQPWFDSPAARPVRRRYGPHILVSDDDPAINRLYTRLLPSYGFQVIAVPRGDGILTLELAQRLRPQLIISDVHKPGMNGYMLHAALRNVASTADIPILTISAIDQTGSRDPLADDLAKPFSFTALLFRIATLLPLQIAGHSALVTRSLANPALDRFHPVTGLPFLHSFDGLLLDLTTQPGWAALDLVLHDSQVLLRTHGRAALERIFALMADALRRLAPHLLIGHTGLDLRLTIVGAAEQIATLQPQLYTTLMALQQHLSRHGNLQEPPLFRVQFLDDHSGFGLSIRDFRRLLMF